MMSHRVEAGKTSLHMGFSSGEVKRRIPLGKSFKAFMASSRSASLHFWHSPTKPHTHTHTHTGAHTLYQTGFSRNFIQSVPLYVEVRVTQYRKSPRNTYMHAKAI